MIFFSKYIEFEVCMGHSSRKTRKLTCVYIYSLYIDVLMYMHIVLEFPRGWGKRESQNGGKLQPCYIWECSEQAYCLEGE